VSNKSDEHNGANINLQAVYDGSPENKEFFKWTPSGSVGLNVVNPAAAEQFIEGAEYYLDFTKVEPATP
jgi:hypothetical protein